jgi:DNA uptake protein ComE-like DNA-binding protein
MFVRRISVFTVLLALLLSAPAATTTKKPLLKPVNINTTTLEELQQEPGIGPATAYAL